MARGTTKDQRIAFLAAGGTGGHIFPAEALAHELIERGWSIHLLTDERGMRYSDSFPAEETHIIASATIGGRNPVKIARALAALLAGYLQSRRLIKARQPAVVVGFGGYPTVPPLLAASHLKARALVHEQNAVPGRANRWLAGRVAAIAMGFELAGAVKADRVVVTGNPVRPDVVAAARKRYPKRKPDAPFRLLVFGGSQGARVFTRMVPDAVVRLDEHERAALQVTQQAQGTDVNYLAEAYRAISVAAEAASFFDDMPARIAACHLAICRAGASTVSELAVIGRPSVLVPYPHALDHDQAANAAALAAGGGAVVIEEKDLTAEWLAKHLAKTMEDPDGLALKAKAAKKTGRPDAARRLADLVEEVAAEAGETGDKEASS